MDSLVSPEQNLQTRALARVPVQRAPQQGAAQLHSFGGGMRLVHAPTESQPIHQWHAQRLDVVVRVTDIGTDYALRCRRHIWQGPWVTWLHDAGCCPACLFDLDQARGRERFDSLSASDIR